MGSEGEGKPQIDGYSYPAGDEDILAEANNGGSVLVGGQGYLHPIAGVVIANAGITQPGNGL